MSTPSPPLPAAERDRRASPPAAASPPTPEALGGTAAAGAAAAGTAVAMAPDSRSQDARTPDPDDAPSPVLARERRVATGGPLVVVGGAEDREGTCRILSRFVELAGGASSCIAVLAVASREPARVGSFYVDLFRRLGAGAARTIEVSRREDGNRPATVEALTDVTGVFFTGGDQVRITRLLGGTRLDRELHTRHARGMALGGTSAGAAMMPGVMIVGGLGRSALREGVPLGPGMEFISGVLIDQHFEERGRLRRLLSAVAQYPRDLGIGVDEDTAALIERGRLEVLGEGFVTVIDASELSFLDEEGDGDPGAIPRAGGDSGSVALSGLRIHILPAGYGFDLGERRPFRSGRREVA